MPLIKLYVLVIAANCARGQSFPWSEIIFDCQVKTRLPVGLLPKGSLQTRIKEVIFGKFSQPQMTYELYELVN